jgi:hypothetical protein
MAAHVHNHRGGGRRTVSFEPAWATSETLSQKTKEEEEELKEEGRKGDRD